MSKYKKTTLICPCCGKRSEQDVLIGLSYSNKFMDLDTFPNDDAVYDRTIICPTCGFSSMSFTLQVSKTVIDTVHSDSYQSFFNDQSIDDKAKKNLLSAYLLGKQKKYKEAGFGYLTAYWYLRTIDLSSAKKALTKAIKYLASYVENNTDINSAIVLIDALRQNGQFNEAMDTLDSLSQHLSNGTDFADILNKEKKLIRSRNKDPHLISEV